MCTVEYLTRLFTYDAWANHEVLTALRSSNGPLAHALKLAAHVLAAERLWLARLEQKEPDIPVWPEFTIDECQDLASELSQLWTSYLAASSEADLGKSVSYRNSKGENWSSRKGDILMHVVMHSAYHRGQIAADMRAVGLTPAYTDFIHSVRQGFVE